MCGPSREKGLVCVGCLKPLKKPVPCSSCYIPLCEQTCESDTNHKLECEYFKERRIHLEDLDGYRDTLQTVLDVILPLRYMLKSQFLQRTVTELSRGEPTTEPDLRKHYIFLSRRISIPQLKYLQDFARKTRGLKQMFL